MRGLPIFLLAAATLGGCATTGDRAAVDPRDPMENFNRGVWDFNQAVDKVALKPASQVYRAVTPKPARRGLSRLLANLMEPVNAANSLLQGKPERALNSLGRFVVNTTIGVGGLADHATELGLPPTTEDFGQTLAVWGAKKSPYLVLPILGPSTVRDGIGTAVDFVTDPPSFALDKAHASNAVQYGAVGVRTLQSRSEVTEAGIDTILETSADPYAAARDAFFQNREAEIANRDSGDLSTQDQDQLLNRALQENQPDGDSSQQQPDAQQPPADQPAAQEPPKSFDSQPQ